VLLKIGVRRIRKNLSGIFPHVASGTSCGTGMGRGEGEGLEGYGRSRGMLLFTSLGPGA